MRRILPLILVAVIAFVLGTSGVAARLLRDAHVVAALPGAAASSPTAATGGASAPTVNGTTVPATVTVTAATGGGAGPTPVVTASATGAPTKIPAPAAPLSLAQAGPTGATLAAGDWTNGAGATLQVMAPTGVKGLRAEVEARPIGQDFKGTPTGSASVVHGVAAVAAHGLAAGRYHWQARLASDAGAGPWAVFAHGATAFGVQVAAPTAPAVSSPTNPQSTASYATSLVTFRWTTMGDPAGIAGYSYRLDTDPNGVARTRIRTSEPRVSLGGLGTGVYYFHVRALDTAGNWGAGATYPVHVDVTLPALAQHIFSGYYFDPALEQLTLDYKVTKASTVTVGIYDGSGTRIRHIIPTGLKLAGVPQQVAWNGRDDQGRLAPAGSYELAMRATDRLGNTKVVGDWGGFNVTYKRIVISLSQQRLFAYDGPTLFLNTLVTTGNKELPTPTGLFHVMFGKSPFVFHSPWPKGSKFYYADSPVTYALYFKDSGYYIHDSPWRTAYGPGTNSVVGAPGQNYTGTHGCVNVPLNVMSQLYSWATPGTPVQIIN